MSKKEINVLEVAEKYDLSPQEFTDEIIKTVFAIAAVAMNENNTDVYTAKTLDTEKNQEIRLTIQYIDPE